MPKDLKDRVTLRHGATLNNRIVQAPMQTWSGLDRGFVSAYTKEYYARRTRSAAMVITEFCYVSEAGGPAGTVTVDDQQLGIFDDAHMEGFAGIAKSLKKDGNLAVMQLVHAGREANYRGQHGETVYAPSKIDFPFLNYELTELTNKDIEQIIQDFADATKRAIALGFDGIEMHGANHYLHQQFFSSYSNKRQDKWGGSLEKRMTFAIEVAKAIFAVIKEHAQDNFIVGYRISPEEIHGSTVGYTVEDSKELIKKLVTEFDLDYVHISTSKYDNKPQGDDKTFAEHIGEVLDDKTKLVIVGNIMSEEDAKDALNYADLVAVGRATLIDPEFGFKIQEGIPEQIVREISPEQVENSKLTPGMINKFSTPDRQTSLPGSESITHLHRTNRDSEVQIEGIDEE